MSVTTITVPGVEFGFDGKRFYFTQAGVSSVQVLDSASDQIVAQIPTAVSPHFVGYPRGSAFGIVVVGGLTMATFLTLFVIPTSSPIWFAVSELLEGRMPAFSPVYLRYG